MTIVAALNVFDQARQFALNINKKPTIILKQTEHFGDTLYATPILRHYRIKYPNAVIIYITGDKYAEIHKYNPHIDKLFTVPAVSDWRASYVNKLFSYNDIDIKLAPAVIFGTWLPSHRWSLPNIFDQYVHNSGITDLNVLGGRKPVAITDGDDENWVSEFLHKSGVNPSRAIALEYHSYSHNHGWSNSEFQEFCNICMGHIYVISLAAKNENLYSRTVDGRGMSWRHSAALLNRVRGLVGVGSGMGVLASSCPNNPFIYEINIPDSISVRKMGFTENAHPVHGKSPREVLNLILTRMG